MASVRPRVALKESPVLTASSDGPLGFGGAKHISVRVTPLIRKDTDARKD